MGLGACVYEPTDSVAPNLAKTTPEQSTSVPSPTATIINTLTEIVEPTEIPTQQIFEPKSTPTPRSSPIPHTTPTSVPIVLPTWVTDPSVNILRLDDIEKQAIFLFNVDTREKHEIPMDIDDLSSHWLWMEDGYFLGTVNPSVNQKIVDIETGQIVRLSNISRDILSPNGRYAARINAQERAEVVFIVDLENETEIELRNPFVQPTRDEEFWDYATVSWSPDGVFLAVLYDKHYYSDNSDYNLAIYTVSGEIFRQYKNMYIPFDNAWGYGSPYRILHTEGTRYVPPCILEVTVDKRTCLDVIDEWADRQNVALFNYTWSPDGTKISYVYYSETFDTGLCYLELATENIVCPITADDLQTEEPLLARLHFWSPDGKYLVLFSDRFGPTDVVGSQKVTVFDIDNQTLWHLEQGYSLPFGNNPWRPFMNPSTNP